MSLIPLQKISLRNSVVVTEIPLAGRTARMVPTTSLETGSLAALHQRRRHRRSDSRTNIGGWWKKTAKKKVIWTNDRHMQSKLADRSGTGSRRLGERRVLLWMGTRSFRVSSWSTWRLVFPTSVLLRVSSLSRGASREKPRAVPRPAPPSPRRDSPSLAGSPGTTP